MSTQHAQIADALLRAPDSMSALAYLSGYIGGAGYHKTGLSAGECKALAARIDEWIAARRAAAGASA